MYEDKTLVCKDCGKEFVFTAGEQEFYAERGFHPLPSPCSKITMMSIRKMPSRTFLANCILDKTWRK